VSFFISRLRIRLTSIVEKAVAIWTTILGSLPRGGGLAASPFRQAIWDLPMVAVSRARYIQPTSVQPVFGPIPGPDQVFDAVRSWGSMSNVSVYGVNLPAAPFSQWSRWACRVEFLHESEAQRFEVGFRWLFDIPV
jgi:hypothetical protein